MPVVADLLSFLSAVFWRWQSWAGGSGTGGAVVVIVGLYERLSGHHLSKRTYVGIFVAAFLLCAFFLAWRDEHTKAEELRRSEHPLAWQRNADEMEQWRERGVTLIWQWQLPALFPNAEAEVNAWREDMLARITRKYGLRAGGVFNTLEPSDFIGAGAQTATLQVQHVLRVGNFNRLIGMVSRGEFRPLTDTPF